MRTLVLLALFVAVPALAQAPPDDRADWRPTAQGVRLLGGSAALILSENSTYLGVSPRLGTFVRDGLALSAQVGVSGSWSRFGTVTVVGDQVIETEGVSRSLGVEFGPAVAYYFGEPGAGLRPFVGTGLFGRWSRTSSEGTFRFPTSDLSLSGLIEAGLLIPIARNVGIEVQAFGQAYDLTSEGLDGNAGVSAGIATFLY